MLETPGSRDIFSHGSVPSKILRYYNLLKVERIDLLILQPHATIKLIKITDSLEIIVLDSDNHFF
ncbi:AAA family ATPase [Pseudomonas sp. S60]|nr:AAA family ATPase [Pseudomonas sp. S60]